MPEMNTSLLRDINSNGADEDKGETNVSSPSKHERLTSLDIVRGYTMAMMIFVDDVGDAYQQWDHSPWNNITLADHVMPWFLFMVGTSMAFSFRKFKGTHEKRIAGTKFALTRAVKLYFLGVLLQGGNWFGGIRFYGKPAHPTNFVAFDLSTLRFCGILNRIGFSYAVVSLLELWLPARTQCCRGISSPHLRLFSNHGWKWCGAFSVTAIYLLMILFTWVPTYTAHEKWEYKKEGNDTWKKQQVFVKKGFEIKCDNYGYEVIIGVADGTPECNAIGVYDRGIFGPQHLGTWMSVRSKDCSSCSPDYCPKPDAPEWCGAYMYDPEGFVATLGTVMSCWIGLHFGLVLKAKGLSSPSERLKHWFTFAGILMLVGLIMHWTAFMPMNKQLWSLSYVLFQAGSCGAALAIVYYLVDVENRARTFFSSFFRPFQYMGMNAILVFFYHGTAEAIVNTVYVSPGENYVNPLPPNKEYSLLSFVHDEVYGGITGDPHAPATQLLYVLTKIGCFMAATWYLFTIKYFWKV